MIAEDTPLGDMPHPKGHNLPPSMRELAAEDMRAALAPFAERRDQFVQSAKNQTVRDRQSAGDAGDTIRLGSAVWKLIDAERTKRSDPHLEAQRAIKAVVDDFWQPVVDEFLRLREETTAFNVAERERVRQQEAEQRAEMARLAKAATPAAPTPPAARVEPAKRTKIRGDYGAVISDVDRQVFTVSNVREVPDWILDSETVHEAIIKVARGVGKHVKSIPGITITTVADTQIR